MPIQQHRPMKMGFPPDFTSFTRSVFSPMAAMAITMKNLLRVLKGANVELGTPATLQTVVMTDANTVQNKLLRLDRELSESQLQMLGTLLNTGFTGLTLSELGPKLQEVSRHAAPDAYQLIELVVTFGMEVLEELSKQPIHTAGIANLLEHPEFQSLEKAQPLMSFLDHADSASLPAKLSVGEGSNIVIGPENVSEALKDSSVVMASYDLGDGMKGLIGVVGPTRMDYAKISARLAYVAQGLSQIMGQAALPDDKHTKEGTS